MPRTPPPEPSTREVPPDDLLWNYILISSHRRPARRRSWAQSILWGILQIALIFALSWSIGELLGFLSPHKDSPPILTIHPSAPSTDDPALHEDSPQATDDPTLHEDSPQATDDPALHEDSPQATDDPALHEDSPQVTEAPSNTETTP